MPRVLKKTPRFPMLNRAINGVFNNPVTRFLGKEAVNALRAGANRLGLAMPSVVPPAAAPCPAAIPAAAPAASQPAPRLPQAQSNNPADIMGDFFNRMKSGLRKKLQEEFNLNAQRQNNAPEDEMDPKKSKSLLPTFGRALTKLMPDFMNGIFEVFASIINMILDLFKVKQETKDLVTGIVKPLGKAMVSGNPGEGLANMATTVAPLLVEGLTKFLGVNITSEVAAAAAAFPQQANRAYVPAANAAANPANCPSSGACSSGAPQPQRRHSHP